MGFPLGYPSPLGLNGRRLLFSLFSNSFRFIVCIHSALIVIVLVIHGVKSNNELFVEQMDYYEITQLSTCLKIQQYYLLLTLSFKFVFIYLFQFLLFSIKFVLL